jgi:hypothetical protein
LPLLFDLVVVALNDGAGDGPDILLLADVLSLGGIVALII